MGLPIEFDTDHVSLLLSVFEIEATRTTWELDDDGVYETYYRTFRFRLSGGRSLELKCSAAFEDYIKIRSVKKLGPVKQPTRLDWLVPKVYKDKSTTELGEDHEE
jgi:hypothetical protein